MGVTIFDKWNYCSSSLFFLLLCVGFFRQIWLFILYHGTCLYGAVSVGLLDQTEKWTEAGRQRATEHNETRVIWTVASGEAHIGSGKTLFGGLIVEVDSGGVVPVGQGAQGQPLCQTVRAFFYIYIYSPQVHGVILTYTQRWGPRCCHGICNDNIPV